VKVSDRLAWLPMLIVTGVLLSILAFLYVKTQSYGESDYYENIALLRHLQQLDAQWELDVLKSRIGINTHYDALADTQGELGRLLEQLGADLKAQKHDQAIALATSQASLQRVIQEKGVLIEQFKSNNSVLRNSLAFLPTAAEDIQQSSRPGGTGAQPASRLASADVSKLLLASMLYSQSPSGDRGAEIQGELARLEAGMHLVPPDTRDRLDIFLAHVRTILREQKVVNELLASITAVPATVLIDEINNALTVENQYAAVESGRYRQYLLVFSVVLVALLLYAALNLVRSHAVIKRVNTELQSANEHLEQRVQERTRELRQAQSELMATARQAGMAEIATNVLHNVGNILNSVNVSADLISSTLHKSRIQGLSRGIQMMNDHAADLADFLVHDEKGKILPGYLSGISQTLVQEQQSMLKELELLTRSIDHIKDVVATQQSYAGGSSIVEPVQICDLVEDALRMNDGSLVRHRVTVVKEFAQVPEAHLEKSRVLQILVNLISNAKNAMENIDGKLHQITLRVELVDDSTLRVSVRDEGEGIPAENLTRIFSHGFTTRKTGHGFGLHSCALAVAQMGGTISAHSDGPGLGATFTLELPIDGAQAPNAHAVQPSHS
jgi:two-component system NtrC family sensor kinase